MSDKVLVLNATYEPLNICSTRRALVLLFKNKAEALEESGRSYHSEACVFPLPTVIKLNYYVRAPRAGARRVSRRAVLARDNHKCQYCGAGTHLTIDHVVPKSRGGPDTWENIVTSCAPCNFRKGDRQPHEVGMRLRSNPRPPDPLDYIRMAVGEVHGTWRRYLDVAFA